MRVFIGADHRGYDVKKTIIAWLKSRGHTVVDMGARTDTTGCDYPKIAAGVAGHVARSRNARGILVCMSGIGQAMAANKVRGAYAALCYNAEAAELSRRHNNANILVLGAKFVRPKELPAILKTWFDTAFEGGRHRRRINQIKQIEKGAKNPWTS